MRMLLEAGRLCRVWLLGFVLRPIDRDATPCTFPGSHPQGAGLSGPLSNAEGAVARRVHAASVLQMMHMLIHAGLMGDGVLEGITMFACYLAGRRHRQPTPVVSVHS